MRPVAVDRQPCVLGCGDWAIENAGQAVQVCILVEAPTAHTLAGAPASCPRAPPHLPERYQRGEGSPAESHPSIPRVQPGYYATGFFALLILAGAQSSTHSSTRAGARGRGGLSARKLGIAPGWSRWRIASAFFLVEGTSWRSMQSARRSALSTREMQRAAQAGLVGARHGSEHGISSSLARVRAKGPGHARRRT